MMLAYALAALGRRADAQREVDTVLKTEDRYGAPVAMAADFERHDGSWERVLAARRNG